MKRRSVSFEDDLAHWIESKADELGVSQSKIIRDAVEAARRENISLVKTGEPGDLVDRIEELETRVEQLEQNNSESQGTEADQSVSGSPSTDVAEEDEIIADFREFMQDHPPRTDHGKAAVVSVLRILRDRGKPMSTGDLREIVYEQHSAEYSDSRTMWQALQRYFDDIPGIAKAGYGEWEYTGDENLREELRAQI